MKPRTRARTPSSIASNQSSKSKPSAATAASFVVSLVMAWSPFQRANAGIIWVEHPETTPTQFQPLPRRDPKHRTHSLFRQGCMLYELIPTMPEPRLRPLMERFGEIVMQNSALEQTFSVV